MYRTPHASIILDNGTHFQGKVKELLERKGVPNHKSSPYRPQGSGAAEAANKAIKTILSKNG